MQQADLVDPVDLEDLDAFKFGSGKRIMFHVVVCTFILLTVRSPV